MSDVRYRSFQQAPQITSRSAKSRASLALPNYNSSKVEWLRLWSFQSFALTKVISFISYTCVELLCIMKRHTMLIL